MDTIDLHETHIRSGSVYKTLALAGSLVVAGWLVRDGVAHYDKQLENVSATMVTKGDIAAMETHCTQTVLATVHITAYACYSLPLRGENFRRCVPAKEGF